MINLSLTKQESQVLIQLIHIAVQSKGLEAAEAGAILARKISEALRESENVPTDNGSSTPSEA